ncbi:MAG: sigma-70 family RNA polymerase sigma factor [Candidatus Aminicenantes bacterium]|nr:sigma-70 family RNA polymerase sigma factor [Candidatus Aminicenantes bacterium]
MNDDNELVQQTIKGDDRSFEMIVKKYQNSIINYLGQSLRNTNLALELSQEVFIKVYSSLHTFNPKYKFKTWLFKIASNHMIDHWRKKRIKTISMDHPFKKTESSAPIQISSNQIPALQKLELKELGEKIEKALDILPPKLRELFVCRHINDMSYDEIAELKELPVGTVKNRVFQAKEMLKDHLEKSI